MSESIIFTEIFGCGQIGKVCLDSFFEHHKNRTVHVFGSMEDFDLLDEYNCHPNITLIPFEGIQDRFKTGHTGTAYIFATAYQRWRGKNVIRFDSDVVFKKECLSIIEKELSSGYDIVGSRRCYGKNPIGIPDLGKYPDTMSTYFLGINTSKYPSYDFDTMCRMWQGAYHPLGYPVLDFADPVIHSMINSGAKVYYLNNNIVGGQNSEGKKFNVYRSNMHLDIGSHLAHFGGVGSGCSVYAGKSSPEKSYADWALIRYAMFCKIFFNTDVLHIEQNPIFDAGGRWVGGGYNDNLIELIKSDLSN